MWQHLSLIPRYSLDEVTGFLEVLSKEIVLEEYQKHSKTSLYFPKKIKVERGSELKISKKNLTRKEQIQLMYLATFHNPEYFKKQKMRARLWNTPRMISCANEDSEFLYLPRGVEKKLQSKIEEIEWVEKTIKGHKIEVEFLGTLKQEQKEALKAIQKHEMSVLSARTAFGKTVVGANYIAKRKVSTLVLVEKQTLVEQWHESLSRFLAIQSEPFKEWTKTGRVKKKGKIGKITGSSVQQTKLVDVVTIQKLSKMSAEDLTSFLEDYGLVIVDEVHHVAASSFERVMKNVTSRYILGLSATPERKDGLSPIIFMRCGEISFTSNAQQSENVLLHRYLYPRFTSIGELEENFEELTYAGKLAKLSLSQERNTQIAHDVVENFQIGRTSLVLSERVEHLHALFEQVKEKISEQQLFVLTGKGKRKSNKEMISSLKKSEQAFVLFATSKYVGEGFDLPQLDTLFFTLPFSWKGNQKQYLGRLERNIEEKDELRVYDYVDIADNSFAQMYQKRFRVYKNNHYELAEDAETRKYQAYLYDGKTYLARFKQDLQEMKETLFLQVPKITKEIVHVLLPLKEKGVEIEILTKKGEVDKQLLAELTKGQVEISYAEVIRQSICVIDNRSCWYGSLVFFDSAGVEESSLRLVSERLARRLRGSE
ncbi:Superfamily II DNA or RNA helicase [Pilibacter termitis]|uniref:Superfamily II DNA or RNA helicase n=1 Tax=Pilibacter termitis TaxID=263852 RepID=A0A1T4M3C1_9ENTE|nr:DEAD/DEAH box helicase family protein [Pilibacter termitis]SJZ61489.1 Superfamily II DNA or RNA helicase [Pilibacter termitis]